MRDSTGEENLTRTEGPMDRYRSGVAFAMLLIALVAIPTQVRGHGFAGKRLFPQTMLFDDPAPLDEFNLFFGRAKSSDGLTTSYQLDTAKRITPWWSIGFSQEFDQLSFGSTSTSGFQNFAPHTKGTFLVSERHETLISWGLDWDIGGIGSHVVGASTQSTLTPQLFFGKGFGDLPPSLLWLQPFAITGYGATSVPLQQVPIQTWQIGFTVQYSLQYLGNFVRDLGFQGFSRTLVRGLVPVVEGLFTSCLNQGGATGGAGCEVTGTINPGFFWFMPHPFEGRGYAMGQLGVEASIPINALSGQSVGLQIMWGTYLDDLFPTSLGAPLFAELFTTRTRATYGTPIFGR